VLPQRTERQAPSGGEYTEDASMKVLLLAGAAAMLLATSYTIARSAPNDGNVWDWRDHQPTRAQTVQKEKAAGVEPTKAERKSKAITENRLDQQLQKAPDQVENPQ
jgi:hypothetical protein